MNVFQNDKLSGKGLIDRWWGNPLHLRSSYLDVIVRNPMRLRHPEERRISVYTSNAQNVEILRSSG